MVQDEVTRSPWGYTLPPTFDCEATRHEATRQAGTRPRKVTAGRKDPRSRLPARLERVDEVGTGTEGDGAKKCATAAAFAHKQHRYARRKVLRCIQQRHKLCWSAPAGVPRGS